MTSLGEVSRALVNRGNESGYDESEDASTSSDDSNSDDSDNTSYEVTLPVGTRFSIIIPENIKVVMKKETGIRPKKGFVYVVCGNLQLN